MRAYCSRTYILFLLYLFYNSFEYCRLIYDQVRKGFAVKGNFLFFKHMDKAAVANPLELDGLRDTSNPKSSEISFFVLASGKGVLSGMQIGFMGDFDKSSFRHPEAFCSFEHGFVPAS